MENKWQLVKLREVLEQNTSTEELAPGRNYRLLGVRLEGKGPYIREEKSGSQIRATRLRKVESGEFIYSRLFAWRGAFGLIPPAMSGAFVSNEFPTFKIDEGQIFPGYLETYFKQKYVWNEVEKYCTGTTRASRNRLNTKFFLELQIPRPSLEEQKRIATRVAGLATKIEKIRKFRSENLREIEEFLLEKKSELFRSTSKRRKTKPLFKAVLINMGQSPPGHSYNSFGDGIPLLNGPTEFGKTYPIEVKWTTLPTKICKKGDILICVRGATTGKMNWADKGYCIGRGLAALTPDSKSFIPEYIYDFLEVRVQRMLSLASGSTFPNLSCAKLGNLVIPILPRHEQRRIVAYLDSLQTKTDELRKLQAETEKEIEELIPSILKKAFRGEI